MTAVCCSLVQSAAVFGFRRLEQTGVECSWETRKMQWTAPVPPKSREGWAGEWMMIALYRSVPVREGKGRSGTGRYYLVLGGTKWYQAVRRRGAGQLERRTVERLK